MFLTFACINLNRVHNYRMPKKRILVVEDDETMRSLVIERLRAEGFECVGAATVESALKKVQKSTPDLVLLDLGFQKTDGMAFLENFRQWLGARKKKDPPVIVVSGFEDKEIIQYAMEAGAADFVKKPYEASALLKTIRDHL